MPPSRCALAILVTVLLSGMTGCAAQAGGAGYAADPYRVVVLGDSLSLDPPVECAGCTGYASVFARKLSQHLHRDVDLIDDAVADSRIADVTRRLGGLRKDLASADLVIVWIGFNDGPPWPDDSPCGPVDTTTADTLLAGVGAYTDECIAATVADYRSQYEELFSAVAKASPHADHAALTVYDNWFGHPLLDESTLPQDRVDRTVETIAGSFDGWNAALCAAATSARFTCVDSYRTLNGSDGRTAAGALLAADFSHLSQTGHDAIAGVLVSSVRR